MGDKGLIEGILYYQQCLDKYTRRNDESRVLYCLTKLYKMPITIEHLEKTGVGRTVNALRKLNGEIAEAAKALVSKWKEMVAAVSDENEEKTLPKPEPIKKQENEVKETHKPQKHSSSHRDGDKKKSRSNNVENDQKNCSKKVKEESKHQKLKSSDSEDENIRKKKDSKANKVSLNFVNEDETRTSSKKVSEDETRSLKKVSEDGTRTGSRKVKANHESSDHKKDSKQKSKRKRESSCEESDLEKHRSKHKSHEKREDSSSKRKKSKHRKHSDDEEEVSSRHVKHVLSDESEEEIKIDSRKNSDNSKHKEEKKDRSKDKKKDDSKSNKSRSDKKQKDSSSKHHSNHKTPKKSSHSSNAHINENGIGSGSGASFAEALGMLVPGSSSKTSKKKVAIVQPLQILKEASPSPDSSPDSLTSKVPDLLTPKKLPPLDLIVDNLLPEITPNYRPIGLPYNSLSKKMSTDDETLSAILHSKISRTKVYSGNKVTWGTVPSLFDICTRVLQDNIDALEYTGGVPYLILKPVIERANADQLFTLEHHNPYLIEDTDELWQLHCNKEFRSKKREEMETWRDMYMRCLDEREAKLKALTANIKQSQDKSLPVRQTKLAYVDSFVKPPRNIARKQAKHGTGGVEKKPAVTPSSRLTQLATSGAAGQVAVPNPGVRATSSTGTSSTAIVKPKKAPLMQKTLALMKSRIFRR